MVVLWHGCVNRKLEFLFVGGLLMGAFEGRCGVDEKSEWVSGSWGWWSHDRS